MAPMGFEAASQAGSGDSSPHGIWGSTPRWAQGAAVLTGLEAAPQAGSRADSPLSLLTQLSSKVNGQHLVGYSGVLSGQQGSSSASAVDKPWSGRLREKESPASSTNVSQKLKEKVDDVPQIPNLSAGFDDGNLSGSEHSLDEEFGIPSVRRPGVKKVLQGMHEKLRRSGRHKNPVGRLTYASYVARHCAYMAKIVQDKEPACFDEAIGNMKWEQAMDEEMVALDVDETWELVPLPEVYWLQMGLAYVLCTSPTAKKLGAWARLCKIDFEGKARKVVGCSCSMFKNVKDYEEETEGLNVVQEYQRACGGMTPSAVYDVGTCGGMTPSAVSDAGACGATLGQVVLQASKSIAFFPSFDNVAAVIICLLLKDPHTLHQAMEVEIRQTLTTTAYQHGHMTPRTVLTALAPVVIQNLANFMVASAFAQACRIEEITTAYLTSKAASACDTNEKLCSTCSNFW
ncbi:hypothetical protein L7F22_020291 [Adiantum nelumboides]|nr:hypothetical protein [Adiantum nelumboides]